MSELTSKEPVMNKEWLSSETIVLIKQRRRAKKIRDQHCTEESLTNYRHLDKRVKNGAEKDWKHWIHKQARELDEAAKSNKQRDVYQMVKFLAGKMTKSSPLVKDKHDNLIHGEAKKLERWPEHFSEILNALPPSVVLQDVPVEYEELDVKLDPPS